MTDPVHSDVAPYVPPGRPVPRFVLLIGVVAALLVVVAVVGPFTARVDVTVPEWRVDGDRAIAHVALTNRGRFAVEASELNGQGLREPAPFLELVAETAGGELDAGAPLGTVRIETNETVDVAVVLVPDCDQYRAGSVPALELDVTVPIGRTRVVRVAGDGQAFVAGTICNPG